MHEDAKILLVALYIEHNSKVPRLESINANVLKMDEASFFKAINHLNNNDLISGVKVKLGSDDRNMVTLIIDELELTDFGLEKAEELIKVCSRMSKVQKLGQIVSIAEDDSLKRVVPLAIEAMKKYSAV
ncbi:hypothetical protein LJC10_05745 [Selenomonadales bacterium OttesenSCG-928-I06]|nr:hypothetical protein [Selenomonadales bacterium OttesenSCG-928-I06]